MKKRIAIFSVCVLVLVSILCTSVFADFNEGQKYYINDTYFDFFRENYNPANYWNILNYDVDVIDDNRLPDISVGFQNTLDDISGIYDTRLLNFGYCVINYTDNFGLVYQLYCSVSLDFITDTNNINRVKISINEWGTDTTTHVYDLVYDYNFDYWYRSSDNLRIRDVIIDVYLRPEFEGSGDFIASHFYNPDDLAYISTIAYPYLLNLDRQSLINFGYGNGYEEGRLDGYAAGDQVGYDRGYEEGKFDGATEGTTGWMNFKNLIFTIFDAPFYILTTALDFELFGINIAGTLIGIISLALIVSILKIIIVRLF